MIEQDQINQTFGIRQEFTRENTELQLRYIAVKKKYDELIMAVESKYPGELRHDTALRYIKEAESGSSLPHSRTLADGLLEAGINRKVK